MTPESFPTSLDHVIPVNLELFVNSFERRGVGLRKCVDSFKTFDLFKVLHFMDERGGVNVVVAIEMFLGEEFTIDSMKRLRTSIVEYALAVVIRDYWRE